MGDHDNKVHGIRLELDLVAVDQVMHLQYFVSYG